MASRSQRAASGMWPPGLNVAQTAAVSPVAWALRIGSDGSGVARVGGAADRVEHRAGGLVRPVRKVEVLEIDGGLCRLDHRHPHAVGGRQRWVAEAALDRPGLDQLEREWSAEGRLSPGACASTEQN